MSAQLFIIMEVKMKIINPHAIDGPTIDSHQISEWIEKFFNLIKKVGLPIIPDFTDRICLVLSDACLPSAYYPNTLNGLKEEIANALPLKSRQRGMLSNANSEEALRDILLEWKEEAGEGTKLYRDIESILDRLHDIIHVSQARSGFVAYKAGAYVHNDSMYNAPSITLYYNVIELDTFGGKSFLQAMEEVFAHELFHAYHYHLCEQSAVRSKSIEIVERKDYTATVVKESLAAYFEATYCKRFGIPTDVKTDWSTSPAIYPYAGAAQIKTWGEVNNAIQNSYTDMDVALRQLVDAATFYEIKNPMNIRERIRIVRVKPTVRAAAPAAPVAPTKVTAPTPIFALSADEIEKYLKSMGTGWFILKCAQDNGIAIGTSTDYGKPTAMASRNSVYATTLPHHNDIIAHINKQPVGSNVKGGDPTLNHNQIEAILKTLCKKLGL